MINFENEIDELSKESEAINSSVALNKILHNLLIESKKRESWYRIIILCLISVIITGIVGFFVYESQFTQEEVTTETSTKTTYSYSEASGENSAINNIQGDQYNDSSAKNKNYYSEEE